METLQPETQTIEQTTVQSGEQLKKASFDEILKKMLYGASMEQNMITGVRSGGKEFPIATTEDAMVATAQALTRAAQGVYEATIKRS